LPNERRVESGWLSRRARWARKRGAGATLQAFGLAGKRYTGNPRALRDQPLLDRLIPRGFEPRSGRLLDSMMRTAPFDRGCVKTRFRSVFGGIKTPPDPKQLEYSAFYEVVFADTSFRAEFLHSLDPQRTFATDRYLAGQCSLRMQRLRLLYCAASIFARTALWRSMLLN
jgi:hypothetical protein